MEVAAQLTAEDLLRLPNQRDLRRELDEGDLVEMSPTSFGHADLASALDGVAAVKSGAHGRH